MEKNVDYLLYLRFHYLSLFLEVFLSLKKFFN